MLTLILLGAFGVQDDADAEAAIKQFKAGYASGSAVDRATAVALLGRTEHDKTLALLKGLLTKDEAPVRAAAARALGDFQNHKKDALTALMNSLAPNGNEKGALPSILEAVGKVGDAGVLATVHRFFEERDPLVAQAALGAVARIGSAQSVDPLIEQLKKLEQKAVTKPGSVDANPNGNGVIVSGDYALRQRAERLIPVVQKTLQAVTGQDLAASKDWQAWWNQNKATFKGKP